MRDGSLNDSRRRNRSLTKLKIVVFSPMPSASVRTATRVNPGDLRSWRRAKQMSVNIKVIRPSDSFGSQRNDRIDARGTAGWHAAGNQRDANQNDSRTAKPGKIEDAYIVQNAAQSASG